MKSFLSLQPALVLLFTILTPLPSNAAISLTDPGFAITPTNRSALLRLDSSPTGTWFPSHLSGGQWAYDATNQKLDYTTSADFRGYYVSQLIDTSAIAPTGNYTLEITYDANNVSDSGTRSAALLYKVLGVDDPSGLTDDSFNTVASSTVGPADALGQAFTPADITPNATELLAGFHDLSTASNVIDAKQTLSLAIPRDFDMIVVAVAGYGFDSDHPGEYFTLSQVDLAVVPEPSTSLLLLGGFVVLTFRKRTPSSQ